METILPQVTLGLAAALAAINIWLTLRVGAVRRSERVSVGDGGNERVVRRMRAHANFGENAWVILVLVLAIELAGGSSALLWLAAIVFVLGRVAHGFGMDGWMPGRVAGTAITIGLQALLAGWAVTIPLLADRDARGPAVEMVGVGE